MRKILFGLILLLAFAAPATAAWGLSGGTTVATTSPTIEKVVGSAPEAVATSVGADDGLAAVEPSPADPSNHKQLFAYGCRGGQAFALWITDKGNIGGTNVPFITCVGRDFIVFA